MKMVVRTVRKERGFTIVPNEVITDSRLSAEARLVHIYLLSRPDNWSAWRTDIMKSCGFGRRKYNRVMSELRNAGYQEFSSGGEGGGAVLTVYETSGCHETRQAQNALGAKRDRIVSTEGLQRTNFIESTDKPLCASGDARFDEWYAQYPKKKGKAEARKAWKRKGLDAHADTIIADTIKRAQIEWTNPQYTPMASTYVIQERWQDEDFVPRTNGLSKGEARGVRRRAMLESVDEVFAHV